MPGPRTSSGFSERRARERFPLSLPVEFRIIGDGEPSGSGKTRNISSNGMLLEVAEPQRMAGPIEVMVSWPYLLDDQCGLKLVMKGRVVRTDGKGVVAVKAQQHEFRTTGPSGGAQQRFRNS